jgi:hypothetical protein
MEVVQSRHRVSYRIVSLSLLFFVALVSWNVGWGTVLLLIAPRHFDASGPAVWFAVLGLLMSIGIAPLPMALAWRRRRNLGEKCWRVVFFGIATGALVMLILSPLYFIAIFIYEFRDFRGWGS